jgi:hypothetical protein
MLLPVSGPHVEMHLSVLVMVFAAAIVAVE